MAAPHHEYDDADAAADRLENIIKELHQAPTGIAGQSVSDEYVISGYASTGTCRTDTGKEKVAKNGEKDIKNDKICDLYYIYISI
ncbi:hypothetical protein [Photorhabdus sp. RM323S]|uniref:hypothetical protein n=1 Tax=Photorhabdus sp. RM323S TaxID=3342828 RepID=UPI0036DE524B